MKSPYQQHNPLAGVRNFEILDDAIILEFVDRKFRYLYNALAPGLDHVMKRLALEGEGLTKYVNQHVREHYASKIPLP